MCVRPASYVTPLASRNDALKNLQFGVSAREGSRDHNYVNYDVPALTTQGQYTFWNPTYTSTAGLTHIIYSGRQQGIAGELRIPYGLVDFTSEVAYIDKGTREALDGSESALSPPLRQLARLLLLSGIRLLAARQPRHQRLARRAEHAAHRLRKAEKLNAGTALQLLAKWSKCG